MIIPANFFDEPRRSVFVELPYCTKNEELSKEFITEFNPLSLKINHIFSEKLFNNFRVTKEKAQLFTCIFFRI